MKFARFTDADSAGTRTVIEVVEADGRDSLNARFHPDLADQFVRVPADAVPGSALSGSDWTHPDAVAPAPVPAVNPLAGRRLKVSPPEYLLLFTPDERIAIRALAVSTAPEDAPFAPYVVDLLSIIDNPRLTFVDLALDQTKRGHDLLIMAGRLTPERQAEIERGLAE